MTTRFPVAVRVNDGRTDRHVTAHVSGLRYRKTAPGGFHSAQMTLHIDPAEFPDLGPADRLWIYGPTGATIWEGSLDNPGRTADQGGVGLSLTVTGTGALASDRTQAVIYIDRDLTAWEPYAANRSNATASATDDPDGTITDQPGLLTQFNSGNPVAPGHVAQIGYTGLRDAGMQFGAIHAAARAGKADTGYRYELAWSPPGGFATVISGTGISTTAGTFDHYVDGAGQPPAGVDAVALRLKRTGAATNVADDNTWAWWYDIAVLGRRVLRDGTPVTGATGPGSMQSATGVRADWVVEDLLGRLLTGLVDVSVATVEAGTYLIDQLAYPDGASAADVLADLARYEPGLLWEILEHTGAGYRFNYRAWPTEVRYEISSRDGYDAPGSDFDLCNRIAVRWVDTKGKDRVTVVTAASSLPATVAGVAATVAAPALSALEETGRIRDAEPITLPEGRGSAANAQRIGEQTLAAKASPPRAGRVTVKRAVVDRLTGGWAQPYELEPGYLARVLETGDLLRVTEVEVVDDDGIAVLTLGDPVLTEEQRILRLARTLR